jgi:hypothetical protein
MDVGVSRARAFSIFFAWFGLMGGALALAGCGGEDGDSTAAAAPSPTPPPSTPPPPAGNRAPTITGAPLTSVLQGVVYSFTPTAADADGNALTFSVTNKPSWATFNSSTGRLRGTPSAAQVGTTGNITISVSDGTASASLTSFSIQVVPTATGAATLMWNPPTQNTDGTPLTNLAGYKVYWGTEQGDYSNSVTLNTPGLSSYVVQQLTPARWYFAMTALNSAGVESDYSQVTSKQIM